MREDPSKSQEFLTSEIWDRQKYNEDYLIPVDKFDFAEDDPRSKKKFVSNSLSGNERNRLFMQTGKSFVDVSMLSATDNLADARSFALLDFDNNGWTDIALMSLNAPRFKLYKNRMGEIYPENKSLRLRLTGGCESNEPNKSKLSNRDAIGARVLVTYKSGKTAMFQKQAGEGFGSQNSSTIRIGCSKDDEIVRLNVSWPSGLKSEHTEFDMKEVLMLSESEVSSGLAEK